MPANGNLVPIVEPGPAYGPIVQPKTSHPNNMQRCPRGCAESRDVSGILRNLWLNESDAEHRSRCKLIEEKVKPSPAGDGCIEKEVAKKIIGTASLGKAFAVPFKGPSRPHRMCAT